MSIDGVDDFGPDQQTRAVLVGNRPELTLLRVTQQLTINFRQNKSPARLKPARGFLHGSRSLTERSACARAPGRRRPRSQNRMTATKNTSFAASMATPAMPPKPSNAAIKRDNQKCNCPAEHDVSPPLLRMLLVQKTQAAEQ